MPYNRQLLSLGLLGSVLFTGLSTGWRAPGQTLFYSTSSATQGNNSVQHVTTGGAAEATTFTASGSTTNGGNGVIRCTALALDPSLQKIFLADAGSGEIWSINLDGTGLGAIATNLNGTLTDLALDTVKQKIYFTTSSATPVNNTIQRVDYSGSNNVSLLVANGVATAVNRCTSLALDTLNSKIVFSDAGVQGLWSMNLDGSGVTSIKSNLTAVPLDVALDVSNQLVYYVTSSANQGSNTVGRVDYNGSGNTLLFTASGPIVNGGNGVSRCTALELDPTGSAIYLADAGSNALWTLNANGSGLGSVLTSVTPIPRRVRFLPLLSHVTVTNLSDSGPGTLRQAIASIGFSGLIDFSGTLFSSSAGTVELATVGDGTFGPSALVVSNQVVITGPVGTNGIIVTRSNGAPTMRLFYVSPTGVLSLKNLTLSNGLAQGGAGGSGFQRGGGGGGGGGAGGAILNFGSLDLENDTLTANQALGGAGGGLGGLGEGSGGGGGGMAGDGGVGGGPTTGGNGGGPLGGIGGVSGTGTGAGTGGGLGGGGGGGGSSGSGPGGTGGFSGGGGGGGAFNTVGFGGGAGGAGGTGGFGGGGGGGGGGTPGGTIGQPGFGGGGGSATADNTGNTGSSGGGGAGLGGAVYNLIAKLSVTNCTFSANMAIGGLGGVGNGTGTNGMGLGGGIFNVNGTINVLNSTFAFNQADQGGGGIYDVGFGGSSVASVRNTIMAYTPSGASDYGATTAQGGTITNLGGHNLIELDESMVGGTVITGPDPKLGPLAKNGGPTPTHILLNHSPAINAGDNTGVPASDQRGYPRIADALGGSSEIVDIGAVEDGLVRLRTIPQTKQSILANGFEIFLTGESNRLYVIQSSTNLTNWNNISTNLVPATELPIFDTTAGTSGNLFYRAFSLPFP